MKTIGILGGMGPAATLDFYSKIIKYTESHSDRDHIHVVIDSNTEIPDRTRYLISDGSNPLPKILESAKLLEGMGAHGIFMPCNTAHYFYEDIVKEISIPFINMIEVVAEHIKETFDNNTKFVLLATKGTYFSKLYQKTFDKFGINLIIPDNNEQKLVMSLIYHIKDKTKFDEYDRFQSLLNHYRGKTFILGCTELPVAFSRFNFDAQTIDPNKLLALKAIEFANK